MTDSSPKRSDSLNVDNESDAHNLSWAAFLDDPNDQTLCEQLITHAQGLGIETIQWFGPTQCLKLAAKLQDGELAGCFFADGNDLVAFLVNVPDHIDHILASNVILEVIDVGGKTRTAKGHSSRQTASTSQSNVNRDDLRITLHELAAGLQKAHVRKRRHQIIAAAIMSFFAVGGVLVFLAVFWKGTP